jgi:hypothetical protein
MLDVPWIKYLLFIVKLVNYKDIIDQERLDVTNIESQTHSL